MPCTDRQRAVAQQLRLMVQLVEILVFVTSKAIFSNLEGLLHLLTLVRSLGSISAQIFALSKIELTHHASQHTRARTHTDSGAPILPSRLVVFIFSLSSQAERERF